MAELACVESSVAAPRQACMASWNNSTALASRGLICLSVMGRRVIPAASIRSRWVLEKVPEGV
jgi:hypothetical protein